MDELTTVITLGNQYALNKWTGTLRAAILILIKFSKKGGAAYHILSTFRLGVRDNLLWIFNKVGLKLSTTSTDYLDVKSEMVLETIFFLF